MCWFFCLYYELMIKLKRQLLYNNSHLTYLLHLFKTRCVFVSRNSVSADWNSWKGTTYQRKYDAKNFLSVQIRQMNKVYLMGYRWAIVPDSYWKRRFTLKVSVFSPNARKYGQKNSEYRQFLLSENRYFLTFKPK